MLIENSSKYRADIDGLRAVAVLSVFFFHLEFNAFSGGFVGVDIFFVISGFLITRLIIDEVKRTNTFSFSNFYIRRIKRLFPALFVVLFICFIVATLLFTPAHLERFSGALIHSMMGISNFFFWSESGYFDTSSNFKPLLHTWSLGVEEQFYLFWPVSLVFLSKTYPKYGAQLLLFIGVILSLYFSSIYTDGLVGLLDLNSGLSKIQIWLSNGSATIFYLTPFRIFEFGIGALIVWSIGHQPKNKLILELVPLFGLVLIMYSILVDPLQ